LSVTCRHPTGALRHRAGVRRLLLSHISASFLNHALKVLLAIPLRGVLRHDELVDIERGRTGTSGATLHNRGHVIGLHAT
jgi:hypothetical protein